MKCASVSKEEGEEGESQSQKGQEGAPASGLHVKIGGVWLSYVIRLLRPPRRRGPRGKVPVPEYPPECPKRDVGNACYGDGCDHAARVAVDASTFMEM